ncbi:hypothetical protein [Pseudomonas aeruginosa]|uniref:hypothetical protein n=1 Tax=Pseudomonas aeruginosa TaxID=287 RepID=UPI003D2A3590
MSKEKSDAERLEEQRRSSKIEYELLDFIEKWEQAHQMQPIEVAKYLTKRASEVLQESLLEMNEKEGSS